MDSLREQVTKICRALNENEVDYIIVGGLAVIFHGYPRSTSDVDFWYKPTVSNFQKLINSLDSLGVDTTDLKEIVFDHSRHIWSSLPLHTIRISSST